MTHRAPPRLATALLNRFGHNSALAGDLLEAYQSRRSPCWYWVQVIGIIIAAAVRDLRRHPIDAVRAIALGLAFSWIGGHYVLYYLLRYDEWLFATGLLRWFYLNGYGLPQWAGWLATAIMCGASGWIVGRSSRQQSAPIGVVVAYTLVVELLKPGLLRADYGVVLGIKETAATTIPAFVGGVWVISRWRSTCFVI